MSSRRHQIKLTFDQIDEIVVLELLDRIADFEKVLKNYDKDPVHVFDTDEKKDKKKIRKFIKALEKVLDYY